jgi:hypothetical protein
MFKGSVCAISVNGMGLSFFNNLHFHKDERLEEMWMVSLFFKCVLLIIPPKRKDDGMQLF